MSVYKSSQNGEVNLSYAKSQKDSLNHEKVKIDFSTSSNQFNTQKKDKDKDEQLKTKKEFSFWSKMCFGIAGAPYQMYFSAISVFTTVFLLEKAQVPPGKVTWIIFVSR